MFPTNKCVNWSAFGNTLTSERLRARRRLENFTFNRKLCLREDPIRGSVEGFGDQSAIRQSPLYDCRMPGPSCSHQTALAAEPVS
jgi:hypothetical protein